MHPFFDRLHRLAHDRHAAWHARHPHHGHHPHHMGRHGHRGFHGFGFEHGGDFPGGLGRGGLGPGRKLGSADLQLLILALLAEKPRHGYEVIKALDEKSNGYYSPSPGMVYPALTYLEEIGHATVETEGTKKLYSVTVAGLAFLDENRAAADTLLQQLIWLGQKMAHMKRAFAEGDVEGTTSVEDDSFFGRMRGRSNDVRESFHALGVALKSLRGASADEQKRIVEVLKRAAEEIRTGAGKP
jgi:DNA-binding PadR family transcriptional regulator